MRTFLLEKNYISNRFGLYILSKSPTKKFPVKNCSFSFFFKNSLGMKLYSLISVKKHLFLIFFLFVFFIFLYILIKLKACRTANIKKQKLLEDLEIKKLIESEEDGSFLQKLKQGDDELYLDEQFFDNCCVCGEKTIQYFQKVFQYCNYIGIKDTPKKFMINVKGEEILLEDCILFFEKTKEEIDRLKKSIGEFDKEIEEQKNLLDFNMKELRISVLSLIEIRNFYALYIFNHNKCGRKLKLCKENAINLISESDRNTLKIIIKDLLFNLNPKTYEN